MTDRELLELAAKAAGLKTWPEGYTDLTGVAVIGDDGMPSHHWHPLDSDGAAFRLAIFLRMDIAITPTAAYVLDDEGREYDEPLGTDATAATRRAIVRAAAAIGAA